LKGKRRVLPRLKKNHFSLFNFFSHFSFVGKFCLAQTDGTFLREENLKRISRGKTKPFKWFKDLIGSGVREVAVV
jgi:hypothetical protein